MTGQQNLNRTTETIISSAVELIRVPGPGLRVDFTAELLQNGVGLVVNDFSDSPRSL